MRRRSPDDPPRWPVVVLLVIVVGLACWGLLAWMGCTPPWELPCRR